MLFSRITDNHSVLVGC